MADAVVKVVDERATVVPFGYELIAPLVGGVGDAVAEATTQADRAETAAEQLEGSVSAIAVNSAIAFATSSTQTVGVSTEPLDGTALSNVIAMLAEPSTADRQLTELTFFAKATGSFSLYRYARTGRMTVTQVAAHTINVTKTGLQTLTPLDFGTIPFKANEYLAVNAAGIATFNSGIANGGRYYTVSGTNLIGPVANLHLEVQARFAGTTTLPATTSDALAPLRALSTLVRTGVPSDPVTGSAIAGESLFLLERPVPPDALYIDSIKVFALAAGTFPITRNRLFNNVRSEVARHLIPVLPGLNILTRAALGDIPVAPGEYLAIAGNDVLTFNAGTVAGAGYRSINGGTGVVGNAIANSHIEVQINFATAVKAQPRALPDAATAVLATDARSLTQYRGRVSKIKRTGAVAGTRLAVVLSGDSWHEEYQIADQLAALLYGKLGKAGDGWISVNTDARYRPLNGTSSFARAGWTFYDASGSGNPVTGGCAPDGHAIYATGTSATAALTFNGTNLTIFYAHLDGTFRYQVDGGAWIPVAGNGSAGQGMAQLAGLANSAHTVNFDLTGNTGTVMIHGFRSWIAGVSGAELHKMGNASATGIHYGLFCDTWMAPILTQLAPSVFFSILATNDYIVNGASPDTLMQVQTRKLAAVRAANPQCAYVLVMPPRTSRAGVIYPLADYRDAGQEWARRNGVEWLNLYDAWDDHPQENANGMFRDSPPLHPNEDGGYRVAAEYFERLLRPGTAL